MSREGNLVTAEGRRWKSPGASSELTFRLGTAHWFRENAHLRLLCVVPISRDGNTVELHAWYERHLFRDISPLTQEQPGRESEE
jgi:hypothetical protein